MRQIWSALSAVSALIAVTVAFDGYVAGPVLLAMAVVVAVAGRRDDIARWAAFGFAVVGGGLYLSYAPPSALVEATALGTAAAISTLVVQHPAGPAPSRSRWSWASAAASTTKRARLWAGAAVVIVYAITTFTVTAGVFIGGDGPRASSPATWRRRSAGSRWPPRCSATRRDCAREERSLPIGGGLALVAAAMAKLFLFDLGTLDGIFRVVVFIVVGLVLLGMGAGYARLLEKQDQQLV